MLPIEEPTASSPAARRPRVVSCASPRSPLFPSCFSTRVALAGKIAGNARKTPPATGPHFIAINPVATVTQPPMKNRRAYSEGFVLRRASSWRLINTALCETRVSNSERDDKPQWQRIQSCSPSFNLVTKQKSGDARREEKECDGARYHRARFE
jgi:hypothetical protein